MNLKMQEARREGHKRAEIHDRLGYLGEMQRAIAGAGQLLEQTHDLSTLSESQHSLLAEQVGIAVVACAEWMRVQLERVEELAKLPPGQFTDIAAVRKNRAAA